MDEIILEEVGPGLMVDIEEAKIYRQKRQNIREWIEIIFWSALTLVPVSIWLYFANYGL